MATMRALVVREAGRLSLEDVPRPEPGPYQALVRIECCGICNSTDWKVIRGQMEWAGPFPLVLGHESVGTVVETGPRVRKFKAGDRVTRPVVPAVEGLGSAFGGFAEYGVVTDAAAMAADGDASLLGDYNAERQNVVSPTIEPVEAALAISLAETASVLASLPNLRGRRVVVAGTGVAGLAFALWCKLAGARVVVLGRRAERLELARAIAADEAYDTGEAAWQEQVRAGGTVDGVIDAIGDVSFAAELTRLMAPDAFACAYGAPPAGQTYGPRWTTADVREHEAYAWVTDLLERGIVRPAWFVTHRWTLPRVIDAFQEVARGEVLKGFVVMMDNTRT